MICEYNIGSTADTQSTPTLRSEIARLKNELEFYESAYLTASQACDTLQKRLDEAHQEICELIAYNGRTPEEMAIERGWDCFKEKEAADDIERMRRERDEARRNLCFTEAAVLSFGVDGVPYHQSVAHKIAEDYGWDCFKEKEEADANNAEFRRNYR